MSKWTRALKEFYFTEREKRVLFGIVALGFIGIPIEGYVLFGHYSFWSVVDLLLGYVFLHLALHHRE